MGKAAADLLTKDFEVGRATAELKSRALSGLTLSASGSHPLPAAGASSSGCAPPGGSVQLEGVPLGALTGKLKLSKGGAATVSVDARLSPTLKMVRARLLPPSRFAWARSQPAARRARPRAPSS